MEAGPRYDRGACSNIAGLRELANEINLVVNFERYGLLLHIFANSFCKVQNITQTGGKLLRRAKPCNLYNRLGYNFTRYRSPCTYSGVTCGASKKTREQIATSIYKISLKLGGLFSLVVHCHCGGYIDFAIVIQAENAF